MNLKILGLKASLKEHIKTNIYLKNKFFKEINKVIGAYTKSLHFRREIVKINYNFIYIYITN